MAIPCKLYPTPVPPAMYHVLGGRLNARDVVEFVFRRAFGTFAAAERYSISLMAKHYFTTIVKVQP